MLVVTWGLGCGFWVRFGWSRWFIQCHPNRWHVSCWESVSIFSPAFLHRHQLVYPHDQAEKNVGRWNFVHVWHLCLDVSSFPFSRLHIPPMQPKLWLTPDGPDLPRHPYLCHVSYGWTRVLHHISCVMPWGSGTFLCLYWDRHGKHSNMKERPEDCLSYTLHGIQSNLHNCSLELRA